VCVDVGDEDGGSWMWRARCAQNSEKVTLECDTKKKRPDFANRKQNKLVCYEMKRVKI
jgi:hypothetical protein